MNYPTPSRRNVAILAAGAALVALCPIGNAAIIVTGNPNQAGTVTVESTTELNFAITTSGNVFGIAFDDWVASSDGGNNTLSGSSSISYRINGGSPIAHSVPVFVDNFNGNVGSSLTARDGAVGWSSVISVTAGQIVTVSPFTLTFSGQSGANFNPLTIGTFTGNAFLFSTTGDRLSSFVSTAAVPEPAEEAACAGLGLMAFGLWRWKAARSRKTS